MIGAKYIRQVWRQSALKMTISQNRQFELPSKLHRQPVEISQDRGYVITLALFHYKSCCTILNPLQSRDLLHRQTTRAFTSLAAVSWERYCLMDAIRLSSKKEARHTLLICSCMVRDWSIFTPRYLTQAWKATSVPLKQADCRSMDDIRERAPTSIISVLSVLSLSLLQFVQKRTSLTQFWTSVRVREKSTGEQLFESSVSSAYLWKTQPWLEITSERGCEYKVNRTGPSTEPWGTPHANGEGEDTSPSTITDWERPVR